MKMVIIMSSENPAVVDRNDMAAHPSLAQRISVYNKCVRICKRLKLAIDSAPHFVV